MKLTNVDQTMWIFAARYAHNRSTGAALAFYTSLVGRLHDFNDSTLKQIRSETWEASSNKGDWDMVNEAIDEELNRRKKANENTGINTTHG